MPVCPKCRTLISDSHYERHLKRCGTTHKHVAQSLHVPSFVAEIEGPHRGITYGPPSRSWQRHGRRTLLVVVAVLTVAALLAGYLWVVTAL